MATATRRQDSCQHSLKGFSLITVSVLLTVAALVFVSLLPGQNGAEVIQKNISNAKKLERVEEAMRSFMATNGRRPCPADGQYAENTAYFGAEAGTPGVCTGNTTPTPNAPLGPDAGTGYVIGGVIPTKTLGLPDEYAYDDYGRRFTYVVDIRATESPAAAIVNNNAIINAGGTTTHAPGCYNLQQSIKLKGTTPGIIVENTAGVGSTVIDHTMYAYISHGASGYGGWPASGSLTTLTSAQSVARRINSGSTDADMQVNAGVDGTFAYSTTNFTNIKIQKDRVTSNRPSGGTDSGFDDLVWYRPDTKNTCCLGAARFQPGFQIQGNQTSTGGLMAVGDINGDGIPDLIVGGNQFSNSIYVIFGTQMGFPDPLPVPTALNGSNGFIINNGAGRLYAYSVATGDINGDGYADIAIVIMANYQPYTYVYVIYGGAGGVASRWLKCGSCTNTLTLANLAGSTGVNGTNGFVITTQPEDGNGPAPSLAIADVNGDGYADLIIGLRSGGATYANGSIGFSAYSNPTNGQYITLNGSNWTFVTSGATGDQTNIQGSFSATLTQLASDLNASADTNISVASYSSGCCGTTITYKTASSAGNSYTLSKGTYSVVTMSGATLTGGSGSSSLLNTGINDVIFGVPDVSGVHKMKGGTSWGSSYTLTSGSKPLDGINGTEFDGVTANYGVAAKATGDINGDGIADIVFGTTLAPIGNQNAYVVFGSRSSWASDYTLDKGNATSILDGTHGFEMDGVSNYAPRIVVGDVNGDGYADVIIGDANNQGAFYVVYGNLGNSWSGTPYALSTLLNGTSGFKIAGTSGFTALGQWMAAGDVNGDGYADILTETYNSYPGTFVIFGKAAWPSSTSITPAWFNGVNGSELDLPHTVTFGGAALAGDINGDGIADVIFGAPEFNNGHGGNDGTAYVYFGHKQTTTNPWPTSVFNLGGL